MITPELRQRVLTQAAHVPSPTRAQTRRAQFFTLIGAAAWSATLFLAAGGARPEGRPVPLVVATGLQALAVAAAAVLLAVRRSQSRRGRLLVALCTLAPLAVVTGKLALTAAWADQIGPIVYRTGFRCLGLSLGIGAAPLAAFLWIWRLRDVRRSRLVGAALGVAAGTVAWTFVDAWCPLAEPVHLALGHILPIALLAAAGLAWRATQGERRFVVCSPTTQDPAPGAPQAP
jgi:hypothetical protein